MLRALEELSRQVGDLKTQQSRGTEVPRSPKEPRAVDRYESVFENEQPVDRGSPGVQKALPEVQAQESGDGDSLRPRKQDRVDRGILSEELR
jgi:hypothetical protein